MSDTVPVLGHVDEYLKLAQEYNVSDVHLAPFAPPKWRRFGLLQPIWDNAEMLTPDDTERLARHYLPEPELRRLEERGDVDFAYVAEIGRFRASVVKTRLGWEMVFRVISTQLKTMEELGLPDAIKPLLEYHNGLVLVTGAVGSGKSTTLAALINEINTHRNDHIITLEDPIEYVVDSKNCHVNQREVHTHTESFSQALRAALREDPDIIMVGEMRDLETISLAITAAETGHLVLATLHTGSAARTLDRILDVFPNEQREQIRIMVGESLRGVISQQLVPRKDGSGRELALELLVNTPAVSAIIRDGKTFMLPGVMQTGKNVGMIMMDDALAKLYKDGLISREEALGRAVDEGTLRANLGA
ncbi:MAG TPA: type IV pilus twitching motility protein PilT [Bacteroidia bacterium]|nr:type IV pilus twitching motility protein PilT [Bacteroidia bacterium]